MAWAHSAVFAAYVADVISGHPALHDAWFNAGYLGRHRFALYNDQVTPDRFAARDLTGYGQGTWQGRELTGAGWPAGGDRPSTIVRYLPVAGGVGLTCVVNAPGVNITQAHGDLMYYAASAGGTGQGLCFHYFGGRVDINGNLSIRWPAPGAGPDVATFTIGPAA